MSRGDLFQEGRRGVVPDQGGQRGGIVKRVVQHRVQRAKTHDVIGIILREDAPQVVIVAWADEGKGRDQRPVDIPVTMSKSGR